MIRLDDPVTLFVAFILVVALWYAGRAVWAGMAVRRAKASATVRPPSLARTGRASSPRVRAFLVVVGVVALFGILATWSFAPTLLIGSSKSINWQLADPAPGVSYVQIDPNSSQVRKDFDEAAARATTVVRIQLNWYPGDECRPDSGWLAEPLVAYTPWSVTITMHTASGFDPSTCRSFYDFWGQPIDVHLSEPLNARAIFDGSSVPAGSRPYP
jgi:hypothetical protein